MFPQTNFYKEDDMYRPVIAKTFGVIIAISAPVIGAAQELIPFSDFDKKIESGFPDGFNAETMGLAIGMDHDEIEDVLNGKFPDIEDVERASVGENSEIGDVLREGYEFEKSIFGMELEEKSGFHISFDDFAAVLSAQKAEDRLKYGLRTERESLNHSVSVVLGTPATGNTAQYVRTAVEYEEALDLASLKASVTEKYGEPSLLYKEGWGTRFIYAFKDGQLRDGDGRNAKRLLGRCTHKQQVPKGIRVDGRYSPAEITSLRDYFKNPWGAGALDVCDAGVTITIFSGDRPNTAQGLVIVMADNIAMYADIENLNAGINEKRNSFVPEAGSTDVPEL
jgi:hypothetical protein